MSNASMMADAADPGDIRTFTLDYAPHLAALGNSTIDDSTWDVPDHLEVIADEFDNTTTSIKINFAAAKIGTNYTLYNRITTNGGDSRRRAMIIPVRDSATFSGPSETKAILDAIRAAMAKSGTRAQLRKQIGDKTIEYMSMSELLIAETRFQQLYNQERRSERIRQGAPFLKNVHTRFLPPM
jgi:hypothetical protein